MSLPLRIKISVVSASALLLGGTALLLAGTAMPGQAASPANASGMSPALCGPGDVKEPGIQGDVPAGVRTGSYNCGVRLVGQLPRTGNVQGVGKCAYIRAGGGSNMAALDADKDGRISPKEWADGKRDPAQFAAADLNKDGGIGGAEQAAQTVYVVDVSDPAKPVEVGSVPVKYASESMRVIVNKDRAILVSGSSVYDIKDCLHPVLLGEIKWPQVASGINQPSGGGGGSGQLPHDLRINHAGTKVYGSFGLWEIDISNLKDPTSWKVTDHRCDVASQMPGPWMEIHKQLLALDLSLCADAARAQGGNYRNGGSTLQGAALFPTLTHGMDLSGDDRYFIAGDQGAGTSGRLAGGKPKLRIIDLSQKPVKLVGVTDGPGHAVDWFHAGSGQYVVHSNEVGTGTGAPAGGGAPAGRGAAAAGRGAAPAPAGGATPPAAGGAATGRAPGGAAGLAAGARPDQSDTCKPYPRSTALGWAFEAIVTDMTVPSKPRNISMLKVAINNPENCAARKASGKDPSVAYHMIDNAMNAKFAAVNFGSAGLRIFDIRQPAKPVEVAYYNHGAMVHSGVGYYDAARGLIYAAGGTGFWVLEVEPQVKARLGL